MFSWDVFFALFPSVVKLTVSPRPPCSIVYSRCLFQEAICLEYYQHNRTLLVHGYGANCDQNQHQVHVSHVTTRPSFANESSLYDAAIRGIDDLIQAVVANGETVDVAKKIFAKQDHANKRYVRNQHCWAASLVLTPMSPWNSQGKNRRAGVLVSPRHMIWARHYGMQTNTIVRFVDKNNTVVERRIVKEKPVPNGRHAFLSGYDIIVGLLDKDVPSSISFAKVLPLALTNLSLPTQSRIPTLDTDFEEKALVTDLSRHNGILLWLQPPLKTSARYQFYEPKITGDSGNPVFLVINKQLVLLFVMTYGGAGGGSSIAYHHDDINTVIGSLGGGYQLTDATLPHHLGAGTFTIGPTHILG